MYLLWYCALVKTFSLNINEKLLCILNTDIKLCLKTSVKMSLMQPKTVRRVFHQSNGLF